MTDRAADPAVPAPPVFLDWRGKEHVGARLAKCRICACQTKCRTCTCLTLLRDDNGKPCHKTCAETEAANTAAAAARHALQVAERYGAAGGGT